MSKVYIQAILVHTHQYIYIYIMGIYLLGNIVQKYEKGDHFFLITTHYGILYIAHDYCGYINYN